MKKRTFRCWAVMCPYSGRLLDVVHHSQLSADARKHGEQAGRARYISAALTLTPTKPRRKRK